MSHQIKNILKSTQRNYKTEPNRNYGVKKYKLK